jgi:hypothetical protein
MYVHPSSSTIAHQRLLNQQIARTMFDNPSDVVAWLGAIQAQDYLGALWAVGLRTRNATEATIERALADRTIVRTWPMRGTLHFVAAPDARWIPELLTPRMIERARGRRRELELDDAILARGKELFIKALQCGKQLPRDAMYQVLEAANISTAGGRGLHIVGELAQTGLLCFGAREGKRHTFALLDEWAPAAKSIERAAALAEIARRYFTSHGPATLQDFMWWSGLTIADARAGLEMVKSHFVQEVVADQTYWLPASMPSAGQPAPAGHLLPAYDECTVAYKDRSAVLNPAFALFEHSRDGILNPTMVVDGQVVGTWKRTLKRDGVVITPRPFGTLTNRESSAIAAAAHRYGEFLGAAVILP